MAEILYLREEIRILFCKNPISSAIIKNQNTLMLWAEIQ